MSDCVFDFALPFEPQAARQRRTIGERFLVLADGALSQLRLLLNLSLDRKRQLATIT
jgi:hypothetical protein